MFVRLFAAAFISVLFSGASFAHSSGDHHHGDIHIMESWARASAPGAPSAGFMKVVNNGKMDDVLLSVSGDFARKLEVHETKMVNGVMKMMHQQEGVVIPAGGEVIFKPGSFHLMFMGLDKNFELGETYTVDLTFKMAGTIQVELPVKTAPMTDMEHTH